MCHSFSFPCFRPGFARGGNRPEAPNLFACLAVVGCKEAPNAAVAATDAGDHESARDDRRRSREVILAIVGHDRIPDKFACATVQRDQSRVICDHEHALAGDCCATIYL